MEHGREEKMRGRVNGYDSLFQKCMNDGSLLDEKPEPMVKMGPETEQLLVEKAVRPPRRCDEMNDRKCGGV
jgi:hypothetical protein